MLTSDTDASCSVVTTPPLWHTKAVGEASTPSAALARSIRTSTRTAVAALAPIEPAEVDQFGDALGCDGHSQHHLTKAA